MARMDKRICRCGHVNDPLHGPGDACAIIGCGCKRFVDERDSIAPSDCMDCGVCADCLIRAEQYESPAEWRCFHCDEVFIERADAVAHFGSTEDSEAACITQRDRGLLASLREYEEGNRELLRRAQEAEYDAEGYSGLRAELKRYFGASEAWTCWNRLDEKQGEIEALSARLASLLANAARLREALAKANRDANAYQERFERAVTDRRLLIEVEEGEGCVAFWSGLKGYVTNGQHSITECFDDAMAEIWQGGIMRPEFQARLKAATAAYAAEVCPQPAQDLRQ